MLLRAQVVPRIAIRCDVEAPASRADRTKGAGRTGGADVWPYPIPSHGLWRLEQGLYVVHPDRSMWVASLVIMGEHGWHLGMR